MAARHPLGLADSPTSPGQNREGKGRSDNSERRSTGEVLSTPHPSKGYAVSPPKCSQFASHYHSMPKAWTRYTNDTTIYIDRRGGKEQVGINWNTSVLDTVGGDASRPEGR